MSAETGGAPADRTDKEALLKHCVIGAEPGKREERTTELMGAVKRVLRHG